MQCFITAARLERKITAPRTIVGASRRKTATRPRLKLFDRNSAQRPRARSKSRERRFSIDGGNLFSKREHAARESDRLRTIHVRGKQSQKSGTAANKRDEPRVAVRRDDPQKRDPLVKDLRRAAQNFTARKQNVQGCAAAAFETFW